MIRAMYTATSAMMTRGTDPFDTVAQNLANVSTPGFHSQYISQISVPVQGDESGTDVQAAMDFYYEDSRPGEISYTGEKFDIALSDGAFFVVRTGDGQLAYTRNGRMKRNADGNVTDRMGNQLMGKSGPIRVPSQSSSVVIDSKGTVSVDGAVLDTLRAVTFDKSNPPRPKGGGLYMPAKGGEPQNADVTVTQGYFERSNVSVMEEMVRMLESVRSFESYQKVIMASSDETTGALVRQTGKVA